MANVLEELKKRGTHLVVALCSVGFACSMCSVELIVLSTKPLDHFCYLKVSEAFTAHMLVVLLFSTCFLAPVLGFHCWGFFSPGVALRQRKSLFLASATGVLGLLVPLGLCQTWCNVLIMFFMGYSMKHESLVLEFLPTINAFLWFKLQIAGFLFIALGFALLGLTRSGQGGCPAGPETIPLGAVPTVGCGGGDHLRAVPPRRGSPYTVAVLFGAFLGPGFAQLGCSFLMIFLFELTLSISYIRFRAALARCLALRP